MSVPDTHSQQYVLEAQRLRDVFSRDRATAHVLLESVQSVSYGLRYVAACDRQETASRLTRELVDALIELEVHYGDTVDSYNEEIAEGRS